jgi:hypothetical protein
VPVEPGTDLGGRVQRRLRGFETFAGLAGASSGELDQAGRVVDGG